MWGIGGALDFIGCAAIGGGGTKQFVTSGWVSRYASTFKVLLLKRNLFFFFFFVFFSLFKKNLDFEVACLTIFDIDPFLNIFF
jgi:hypothetical protein